MSKLTTDEQDRFEKWVYDTRLHWAELAVGKDAEQIERLMYEVGRWEQGVRMTPAIHVRGPVAPMVPIAKPRRFRLRKH